MPDQRPIDGQDILPILTGGTKERIKSIPFRYGKGTSSLIKGNYKLLMPSHKLYDLSKDRAESQNLANTMPERASNMEKEFVSVLESSEKSQAGSDYNDRSFTPVDSWKPLLTAPKEPK